MTSYTNRLMICSTCGFTSKTETYCKNNSCTALGSKPMHKQITSLEECVTELEEVMEYSKAHYLNPDTILNCINYLKNTCPKCGYDGGRYGHTKQLNPQNPNRLICGNCSEAFK